MFTSSFTFLKKQVTEMDRWFLTVQETFFLIKDQYVHSDISTNHLFRNAIRGMVSSLDQYSEYLTKSELEYFQNQTEGKRVGIGIEIHFCAEHNKYIVSSVHKNTPADTAGLRRDDQLITINDLNINNKNIDRILKMIQSNPNEVLHIKIARNDAPINIDILPESINVEVLQTTNVCGIDYIKLALLTENISSEFKTVLENITNNTESKGILLDLRDNSGGIVHEAIKIADFLINDGIITTIHKKNNNIRYYSASRNHTVNSTTPITVLINSGTASSAELLALALRENDRAKIIGDENSLGKNSIQSIIPLKEFGAIKLTTAYYHTPSGQNINKIGITPDISIPRTPKRSNCKSPELDKFDRDVAFIIQNLIE